MLEKKQFTPEQIAHEKAQACLEIALDQIKRQASQKQREYLFQLYREIIRREDAYPLEDTLAEVFLEWLAKGQIVNTELYRDMEADYPDIYVILQRWFKRAKPFFYATGHDGAMTPFRIYQSMPAISYTDYKP